MFASLNTCLEPVCTAFLPCKSKCAGGTISNKWQRQRDTHRTLTELSCKGEPCTKSGVYKSIRCCLAGESTATAALLFQSVFAGHWPEEPLPFLFQKQMHPHLKRQCCPHIGAASSCPCQQPVLPWLTIPQQVSLADLPLPCLWNEITWGMLRLVFLLSPSVSARPGFPSLQASDPPRHQKPRRSPGLGQICQVGWVLLARLSCGGLWCGAAFE